MANGKPIKDITKKDADSGYDPEYPFKNRDPRFYDLFIYDGVKCVKSVGQDADAAELLEQASALMAQAKSCHDELETYYRAAVDFGKVDEAAAECMEMFGLK